MSGDVHVRFCEGPGVKLPGATHQVGFCRSLTFGLDRSTVQLCCSAIGGSRPSPVIPLSPANGCLYCYRP